MPRHSSMEMFNAGDPASNGRKQTYERYRCHEGAKSVTRPLMSDTCAKLITSMSAIINDGALREYYVSVMFWLIFITTAYIDLSHRNIILLFWLLLLLWALRAKDLSGTK